MANGHGGKRPGAGRPKGSGPKKIAAQDAVKIVKDLKDRGKTPLDFFKSILLDPESSWEDRKWAAKEAAPYIHARLSAVDMKSEETTKYVIRAPEPCDTMEQWWAKYGGAVNKPHVVLPNKTSSTAEWLKRHAEKQESSQASAEGWVPTSRLQQRQ